MKSIEEIKKIIQQHKTTLKEEYGVREIGIFGSYVRNEQAVNSDLDVLVEFERPVGFFKFLDLEEYLEKITRLHVDLVTRKALKPTIGKYILEELVPV